MSTATTTETTAEKTAVALPRDPLRLGLLCVSVLSVAWAYLPAFREMGHIWFNDTRYSHGFLVPMFAPVHRDLLYARHHAMTDDWSHQDTDDPPPH